MKQSLLLIAFGVCLFAALMNLSAVLGFGGKIIGLILPVLVGGILAMFINVPMTGIEKRLNRLFGHFKRRPSGKLCHILSFILTLVCVALVLLLVSTLIVPELIRSVTSLYVLIEAQLPQWLEYLNSYHINAEWLQKLLAGGSLEQTIQDIPSRINTLLGGLAGAVSSTVSVILTSIFAVIFSVYMALDKARLCRHSYKFVCAFLPPAWAKKTVSLCGMFSRSFAKFLSGQCCEAVILGTLMFCAFLIFRLPYASLVGVLTAVCAIIPYVGAFISCIISTFLALLVDPMLAVRCLIVYLVIQFIENQFIYPRVVGGSVGLPPLYTLAAAIIGAKLFGIIGILFFIPLAAVFFEALKKEADHRLGEGVPPDSM